MKKMSIWPQNKNRKFYYQKCCTGQMPIFSYDRFNFFFRIYELRLEEDIEQKKVGITLQKVGIWPIKRFQRFFP